jgi:pimeloyl-ACP methyl ester carboxylesterase
MKLLLLHGAIGSSEQLKPLAGKLKSDYDILLHDFAGHGGRDLPPDFSIEVFANDVLHWMNENSINNIDVFGYSMGGYVALYIAKHFPGKINRIFTLATKFDWTPEGAAKETNMLDADKIEQKLPDFADALKKRHYPHDWKKVLGLTSSMLIKMGQSPTLNTEDFESIENEVLLSVGEYDKMVTIAETENVARIIPKGKSLILPDTKHPIEVIDLNILANQISAFFK